MSVEYVEIDKEDLARLQIIDLAARDVMNSANFGEFDPDAIDVLKQALETPGKIRGFYWFGKMPKSRLGIASV
jgi:hypothetical protein